MTNYQKDEVTMTLAGSRDLLKTADRNLRRGSDTYLGTDLQGYIDDALLAVEDAIKEMENAS